MLISPSDGCPLVRWGTHPAKLARRSAVNQGGSAREITLCHELVAHLRSDNMLLDIDADSTTVFYQDMVDHDKDTYSARPVTVDDRPPNLLHPAVRVRLSFNPASKDRRSETAATDGVESHRYGDVERREKKVAATEQYDDQHNAHLNDRGYRRRCSHTSR